MVSYAIRHRTPREDIQLLVPHLLLEGNTSAYTLLYTYHYSSQVLYNMPPYTLQFELGIFIHMQIQSER